MCWIESKKSIRFGKSNWNIFSESECSVVYSHHRHLIFLSHISMVMSVFFIIILHMSVPVCCSVATAVFSVKKVFSAWYLCINADYAALFVQRCHHDRKRRCLLNLHSQARLQPLSAQAHHRGLQNGPVPVHHAVILALLVLKPSLFMTLKEMSLLVILSSELVRLSLMSVMCPRNGCRDASVTGLAIFRRLSSRFLDLELYEHTGWFGLVYIRILVVHCVLFYYRLFTDVDLWLQKGSSSILHVT